MKIHIRGDSALQHSGSICDETSSQSRLQENFKSTDCIIPFERRLQKRFKFRRKKGGAAKSWHILLAHNSMEGYLSFKR